MKNLLLIFCAFSCLVSIGQRTIMVQKKTGSINVDGNLDENDWLKSSWTSEFTQMKPFPGEPSPKQTMVSMVYDKEAIYFGVKCFDDPDSISRVLSIRDDYNPNLDVFGIFIDNF